MTDAHAVALQARMLERAGAEVSCLVRRFPELESVLSGFAGTMPPFVVDPSEERVVDLTVGAGRYYGRDARDVAGAQVSDALGSVANISSRASAPTEGHGRLHAIGQELLRAADLAGDIPSRLAGASTPSARFLVLAGLGLGHHVLSLIDRLDPRYVLIYEPQPLLLYCASFTVPWRRIAERFEAEGRSLLVISGQSDEASCHRAQSWLNAIPALNFDGGRWIQHYENPAFEALKAVLSEHVRMLNRAPGFFIDERRQLVHTLANLPRAHGILAERRPRTLDADLILVGSGPTLDEALPLIGRARNRAVIFSCGTGLTPLLRAGILPDFHVELETSSGRYALASAVEDPEVFRSATLIASNGYYPPSFDLFDRRLMFLRQGNFAAWMFRALGTVLAHGAPTVTNAAAALAHWLGFRRIFAFGVDLGYYDTAVQHSRKSLYFDEKRASFHPTFAHLPGGDVLRSFYPTSEIEVADNEGGRILTNDIFYRSLRAFDAFIHDTGAKVLHCGRGARIQGSEDRRISELSESDFDTDRPGTLAAIAQRFHAVKAEPSDLEGALARERSFLGSFVGDIARIARTPIGSDDDFQDRANAVSLCIRHATGEEGIGPRRLIGGEFEKLTVFASDLMTSARTGEARVRVREGWRAGLEELGRYAEGELATIVPGQGIDPLPGSRKA